VSYLLDPDRLHEITREAAHLPALDAMAAIEAALHHEWPGRIHSDKAWLFNTAAGAMGQLRLLYGSLTEYLIFFGTPIGTEGHSGRYPADVYDFMIAGEMWTYHEGDLQKSVFLPGDKALLSRGRTKGYRAKDETWMLEYARGAIPLMLPTGSWDNLFSNLDLRALGALYAQYGGLVVRELLRGKF
jgi:hypothetical protein